MIRLQKRYQKEIIPALQKEFKITNLLDAPRITKVVLSMGIGDIVHDKGALVKTKETLKVITGQTQMNGQITILQKAESRLTECSKMLKSLLV